MSAQVISDGTWLTSLGVGTGGLNWSSVADGGCEQASWTMPLPESFNHHALRTGARVEVREGSLPVFAGLLSQPNITDDGWEFTAIGLSGEADSCLCLDEDGNTTSIPDVAVAEGIARGQLPWTLPESLSSVPFAGAEQTDALNFVSGLLDAWATSVGKRWRVDADGAVRAYADPTVPTWYMTPGTTRLGLADDDYASDLYLRFKSSTASFATVHVSDALASGRRRREAPVDLTGLGVIASGKATAIGNGMMAKGKARYAYTDAANPNQFQLTTPGGRPAWLSSVRAGQMVRTHGVINQQGQLLPHVDWIIGKPQYEDGAREIQLAPTELAARALGDVLAVALS